MTAETTTTSHEQLTPEGLLTEAVDLRLPPETDHKPAYAGFDNMVGVRREMRLFEGAPQDQKYITLRVTSDLEDGAPPQYSVKETKNGHGYTWTPGKPVVISDARGSAEASERQVEMI